MQESTFDVDAVQATTARKIPFATTDAVIQALYAAICFELGHRPDWEVHTKLFIPSARLVRVTDRGVFAFDCASYKQDLESMISSGDLRSFYEHELWRDTWEFGDIAHITSAYRTFESREGCETGGGINCIQLLRREGRWWISAMLWRRDGEDLEVPVSARALRGR